MTATPSSRTRSYPSGPLNVRVFLARSRTNVRDLDRSFCGEPVAGAVTIREMCLADSDPLLVFRPRCSNRALPLIGQVLHAVPGRGSSVPTGRHVGLSAGDDRMREYSEYVACPCCGGTMRLARTVSRAEVPPLETFECKPCGLAVTAEAVSESHALLEKRYFY
jgi:hypothetical protein